MIKRLLILMVLVAISALTATTFFGREVAGVSILPSISPKTSVPSPTAIPGKKVLKNDYHIFQSFNNCGPASLSMTLSYYGIKESQEKLGQNLRPWQNAEGVHDDKSVTLAELAEKAKEYDLIPYHRPNGSIEMMQQFIAADIPVMTRTWLEPNEDIGHYRVVKGYDKTAKTIIQDDSYQDKNLTYAYDEFNEIWAKFNYEYLVLLPEDKKELAAAILGKNVDETYAWEQAKKNSLAAIEKDPENIYNHFNLSVAYYNLGDFKKSIEEFEKVESKLPFRTLWYQIEPLLAYYELENYDRVISISDVILGGENSAYSELYLLRGKIFEKQSDLEAARAEYEKAVYYNQNLKPAKLALESLS